MHAALLALLTTTLSFSASAAVVERQVTATPQHLYAYALTTGQPLGVVSVDSTNGHAVVLNGTAIPVTPSAGSTFYINPTTGFLYVEFPGSPHAFIDFTNNGSSCGPQGPVIFATSDSNKCAAQSPFTFTGPGNQLLFSTAGSFQVCGTDNRLEFEKTPPPIAGPVGDHCVNVRVLAQPWH